MRNLFAAAFAALLLSAVPAWAQSSTSASAIHLDATQLIAGPTSTNCSAAGATAANLTTTITPGVNQSVWVQAISFDQGETTTGTTGAYYLTGAGFATNPIWAFHYIAGVLGPGNHWTEAIPGGLRGLPGTAVSFTPSGTIGTNDYLCYRVYYYLY